MYTADEGRCRENYAADMMRMCDGCESSENSGLRLGSPCRRHLHRRRRVCLGGSTIRDEEKNNGIY